MTNQCRFSRQMEAIIQDLHSRCDHPCADSVYNSVKIKYPNISLGTVYRNLGKLTESGEISSITIDGKEYFDGNIKPHFHFYCTSCNKIFDIFDDSIDQIIEIIKDKCEYKSESIKIVINGKCNSCLNDK